MTQLVGILNLTPDSFSDGGAYLAAEHAYAHAETLIKDGAHILDIGAESTRPHATPINAEEEISRLALLPELVSLAKTHGVKISLDTRHAATAAYGIKAGVDWINDVSAGADANLLHMVAEAKITYVAMHSLTVPADPAIVWPPSAHPLTELNRFIGIFVERLMHEGLETEQIILDPGIGFGKSARQSLELLWDIPAIHTLGCRLLIGHSRKSCFSLISLAKEERDSLTLLASAYLIHHGISYLRVHDVARHATLMKNLSTIECE